MKVLLSPAKSIDESRKVQIDDYTISPFLDKSEVLVNKLKKFSSKKLGSLMDISPELSELNVYRFQNWRRPETIDESITHAISAFTGEVYRGFDVLSLNMQELMTAQEKVRILSGLYGILKPLDLIYPYRLEMGTRWMVTPKTTNLYKFWGKSLSESLNKEMQGNEKVINLASTEYFKAIDKKTLKADVITPVFKEFKNGDYKVIMTFAKNARGAMARYIVKNNITNPEELKSFDTDGYRFDENMSNETEWVFTR